LEVGKVPACFDQQPVKAHRMICAWLEAHEAKPRAIAIDSPMLAPDGAGQRAVPMKMN
jgi:hypothetical protein